MGSTEDIVNQRIEPAGPNDASNLAAIQAAADRTAVEINQSIKVNCLLGPPFKPFVSFMGGGQVSIWLEEFALDAQGKDLLSAQLAIVREVQEYVTEWGGELSEAPNHSQNEHWVRLVLAHPSPERIYRLLFEA